MESGLSVLGGGELFGMKRGVTGDRIHAALTVKTGGMRDEEIILRALSAIPEGEFNFTTVSTARYWEYPKRLPHPLNIPE